MQDNLILGMNQIRDLYLWNRVIIALKVFHRNNLWDGRAARNQARRKYKSES